MYRPLLFSIISLSRTIQNGAFNVNVEHSVMPIPL
jgi:hypothetical protein